MKQRVSKREMIKYHDTVGIDMLGVGGYALQHLLKGVDPIGYSVRHGGWACDYYELDGLTVSMGYDPIKSKINGKRIKTDYAIIRDYDNKAFLIYNNGGSYDQRINAIKLLRDEFIKEVKGK